MANPFAEKVAVVTGGASGIGRAVSELLVARGARVVLADRNEALLAQVVEGLRGGGGVAEPAVVDVTAPEAVAAAVRGARERHGRLDYLFNNAGIATVGEVRDLSVADWEQIISVNLYGVIHGVRAAYPLMIEQGFGHIVNTASVAGFLAMPGIVAYSTTKHAVVGLSLGLRAEAAIHGVQVSVVCPGVIDTSIVSNAEFRRVDPDRVVEKTPFKPYPVDACARDILRGVARNHAVIVVTPHGKALWRLARFFPGLVGRMTEREFRRSREIRLE